MNCNIIKILSLSSLQSRFAIPKYKKQTRMLQVEIDTNMKIIRLQDSFLKLFQYFKNIFLIMELFQNIFLTFCDIHQTAHVCVCVCVWHLFVTLMVKNYTFRNFASLFFSNLVDAYFFFWRKIVLSYLTSSL